MAVIYYSVGVVKFSHIRDCVIGCLVNEFDQLTLAVVLKLFQKVLVRNSQEVNKQIDSHIDVGLMGVVAVTSVFTDLLAIRNFLFDLILYELSKEEFA